MQRGIGLFACLLMAIASQAADIRAAETPRHVIVIITDDQGWGDFGFHGNPVLKTPTLDRLASESVELTRFHVCPVCAPTRASLMTGRYNYRTGAIDTYLGRATMVTEEVTLAEMFASAGYATGIFGKWHLGDNYPSRPQDQGFVESLVHRGGGIGQPSDPPGNSYFNPMLLRNGRHEQSAGYCSDVFTDAAIRFLLDHKDQKTFTYLAFNCPHTPLEVPEEYHARYRDRGLDDATAKIYGMIANIDDNLHRLFNAIRELDIEPQTLVVFLTDNGPQQRRYNGQLRDAKGSVYDGGIRVPCLLRWPGQLKAGQKVDAVAAHIDLAPTLLAACGITPSKDVAFDGVNLWPLLRGEQDKLDERLLFFQWHRGDVPEKFRACAVRGPRFKFVQAAGRGDQGKFAPRFELFDIDSDPGEKNNVLTEHPQIAADMKAAYERWFDDVGSTRGYPPPRIIVGTEHENPVTLTRQDWRGPKASWVANGLGYWDIEVPRAGTFTFTVRIAAANEPRSVRLQVGQHQQSAELLPQQDQVKFPHLALPPGTHRVEAVVGTGDDVAGAHYVDVARLND